MEAHPESFSTYHTRALNTCGIFSKSLCNGGFGYIFCPPQLHKQRVKNAYNIYLEDSILATNRDNIINDTVKYAKDSPYKQTYPKAKSKFNHIVYRSTGRCRRDSFYKHEVSEIPVILNSTRMVPGINLLRRSGSMFRHSQLHESY